MSINPVGIWYMLIWILTSVSGGIGIFLVWKGFKRDIWLYTAGLFFMMLTLVLLFIGRGWL